MSYRVDTIPNRSSPPTVLLRRHWREGRRVRKETVANLTRRPEWLVEGIRSLVGVGAFRPEGGGPVEIRRSLPHGHAAAILGGVSGNEMLGMLDWLLDRQPWIERSLANRRLAGEALILYDLSSSYVEGRRNALAAFGHSRDGRRDRKQIEFGLLCDRGGCPVAVEAFEGSAADPATLGRQIEKIRRRFGLGRVALVGDRGMITGARIREELAPAGLDWISALKSADIRKLMKGPPAAGAPVPDAVAEIASPDFPGERLMVCFNPRLRDERRRKREELLKAMEDRLKAIARIAGRPGSRLRACAAGRRSPAASARTPAASRSPSTSRSTAKRAASRGAAARSGSTARRRWTGYGSSAPASAPEASGRTRRWRPTRAWRGSSRHSARSRPGGSGSGRSSSAARPMSAPMSSCACLRSMSNGT